MTMDTFPLALWLTDRSRYSTGTGRCARQRLLTNHFGPTGYGIVRKAESLPLATGNFTHQALEVLFRHLAATDTFPTVEVIREAVRTACAAYEARIAERGYRGLLASEKVEQVVAEQNALLGGLVWAACRTVLPWIHREYRVVEVETESIYVLDCSCGLGSGNLDASAHAAKGCTGIGQMLRQDVLAEKRHGGGLAYFESKTTGWAGDNWAPQWETKPQLGIGTFGVKERLGREVTEAFILALYKGARKKTADAFGEETYRQDSPLCYGYCRRGNPPIAVDDWVPAYEWIDENGETRRKSRAHEKRGVWELRESDWPVWLDSTAADPSLTPTEVWLNWLPPSVVDKQVFLVGPLNRQDWQIESLKRQVVGEERHWQQIVWELYDLQRQGYGWASEEYQQAVDRLVPASYECRRFGVRSECEFVPICFRQAGWEDPVAGGVFVPRRPHHEPELLQAVGRGLLPDEGGEVEEEE